MMHLFICGHVWFNRSKSNYFVIIKCIVTHKSTVGIVVAVVTRPLLRNGGMAEDHGATEAGQLTRAWTRGRKETESRQRVSGAKSPWLDSAE